MSSTSAPPSRRPGERARPLGPDERRAAILDAVMPLLMQHGRDITTRQIAEAAGIAEGTVFRAFGDKETLMQAAIDRFSDPEELRLAIASVDRSLPREQRIADVLFHLRNRFQGAIGIMHAVGMRAPEPDEASRLALLAEIASALHGVAGDAGAVHPEHLPGGVATERIAHYLLLISIATALPHRSPESEFTGIELAHLIVHGLDGPRRVDQT